MKHCPSSSVALALFTIALVSAPAGCSAAGPAATPARVVSPAASPLPPREAFVAHLETCAGEPSASRDDGRRESCAAAFELRGEASTGELARWRDAAWTVCSELSSSASIAVCRGVAELSLSGPLEDHRRAREALGRGCHMHGDYASCLRLRAFRGTVHVARAPVFSG